MKDYPTPQRVLSAILDDKADQHGARPFILAPETVSYEELRRRAANAAGGLHELGVRPGDPVLVFSPNSVEMIVAVFAITWLGAVEVPVNSGYLGSTLAHVVTNSTARTIVVAAELVDTLFDALPADHLEHVVVIGELPALAPRTLVQWDTVADGPAVTRHPSQPRDLVAIMYTSGTTGPSKGVMVSNHHAYQYANPAGSHTMVDGEIVYVTLPLFHIGAQWAGVLAAMLADGQVALRDKFSVSEFWADVDRWGATQTILLGVMAEFLYAQPRRDDDGSHTLRRVNMGPVLSEAFDFMDRFQVRINPAYGMTEVGCVTASPPPDEAIADPWSVGWLRTDLYEAKIVDENDDEVAPGTPGELLVRPRINDIVTSGYWRNPEATVNAWRNLWFHTGDSLVQAEDGSFRFLDRLTDSIRRRGENISSHEIEREAMRFDGVAECAAVAVRSEHAEAEIKLTVVFEPGQHSEPTAMVEFLCGVLPTFMVPRFIEVLPELPKTPTGKIQKAVLRSFGTDNAWDRDQREGV